MEIGFPPLLKGTVYKSYAKTAILYWCEVWRCLSKNYVQISQMIVRSMVRTICGVQLRNVKRAKDMMLVLGLDEAMGQLVKVYSVSCYAHVLRREAGHG